MLRINCSYKVDFRRKHILEIGIVTLLKFWVFIAERIKSGINSSVQQGAIFTHTSIETLEKSN